MHSNSEGIKFIRTAAYIIEVKVKKKAVGSVSGPSSQLRVILTKV